jgi:sugar O-acyltransferase (sialic acid O-acetyltransferase NeuD family)
MTSSGPQLVIVGDGEFAEIAYEYFTHDSPYTVAAFAVERSYLTKAQLCGLPVVAFEDVERQFHPATHEAFVAVSYAQLNRIRTRLYHEVKRKGYRPATYVSSRAFVWRNATVGENCFIFENNVIQYRAAVGNNCVLWSGNHVGHRAVIGDHCFISSHVVISGYCEVGESSFIGVNSCVADRVKIGRDCVIGAGSVIVANTEPGKVYKGDRDGPSRVSSLTLFKVREAS